MSEDEKPIVDTTGKFVRVVVDGNSRNDVEWQNARILLSNKRVVIASSETKHTIPLSSITSVKVGADQSIGPDYVSVQADSDVLLVAAGDDPFEERLYAQLVDREPILTKHPAVAGGVVQDTDWETGRISTAKDRVDLAVSSGTFLEIGIEDVGSVQQTTKVVEGSERRAIEVEHAVDGQSVETHLAGDRRTISLFEGFCRRGSEQNAPDVDLSETEAEVLMALYSGVSPFEIPDFVGLDVDRVEDIYDRLIEHDVLEPIGTRREVELEARGRSIASEEMSD